MHKPTMGFNAAITASLAILTMLWSSALGEPFKPDGPSIAAPALPDADADRDIVIFAGGAVQIRVPLAWQVSEVAVGREIRLLITPESLPAKHTMPSDGMWMTYHVRPPGGGRIAEELAEMMKARLYQSIGRRAKLGTAQQLRMGNWPALKQEFFLPAADARGGTNPAALQGFHLLVRTAWGFLELHAATIAKKYPQRQADFGRLLAGLKLTAPKEKPQPPIAESARDAAEILGWWKAHRSRLGLRGDGQIVIRFDRRGAYAVDQWGSLDYKRKLTHLTGSFQARGDLLLVTWDDGSRLNYRWRLHNGELLMTDHRGQVSQLRRLLQ